MQKGVLADALIINSKRMGRFCRHRIQTVLSRDGQTLCVPGFLEREDHTLSNSHGLKARALDIRHVDKDILRAIIWLNETATLEWAIELNNTSKQVVPLGASNGACSASSAGNHLMVDYQKYCCAQIQAKTKFENRSM